MMSPHQYGGELLPTPPITPYTPLPPTYPPSPSYHFGGQKGGIMLLRKRATKKPKKNFWKNFEEKRSPCLKGVYIYYYEDYNYGIPNEWVMVKEKI